ncbi:MAG: pseudouridine synthase, partial [Bacteroidota bacterium]
SFDVRSKKVEKEYYVLVDGIITDEAIQQMKVGVQIRLRNNFYDTLPCEARILESPPNVEVRQVRHERHGPTSWVSITLREGKFRQVRKMTAAVGFPTLRLIRVRIGHIELGNLKAGEAIQVDDFNF